MTVNAAATTLPQTSEASSSTQQSLVSSPVQEQPEAAETQELSSRDTIDRPGPSHVMNVFTCSCMTARNSSSY